ncbi:hypothetical protein FIBSPDRAFT_1047107 [Athelia psychrophila]|uniref:BTB domain-containing protein n=1 Tax=Athelia psychrophila TaxID=1759441 RepID=A0A166FN50_9AGAM|nr:hypothetical protein FIBSPDRAFT_1047107 [Fibularhizoctonia sp. CBS 109695]
MSSVSLSTFELIESPSYCSSECSTVVPIRPSLVVDDNLTGLKDVDPVNLAEPASQSSSPVFLDQDPDFFIEDVLSVFRVENCLFKVHRFFLDRESTRFPQGVSSTTHPIDLDGVSRFEFKSLMNFFYHGMHNTTTPSLPQWTALLSISTRFDMFKVRERAISEITSLRRDIDPIDQIALAQKYDVPAWLSDAYTALCERERPLAAEEARKMNGDIPYLIAEARENILKAQLEDHHSTCRATRGFVSVDPTHEASGKESQKSEIVRRVVDEVFGREERAREAQRLAAEQEIARQEGERVQKELYEREKEKQRKLKEAKEAKERAEEEIMRMESGDDYLPTQTWPKRKASGPRAKGKKILLPVLSTAEAAFE